MSAPAAAEAVASPGPQEEPVPEPADLAIETSGLTKRFKSVAAVDQLALKVPSGSVFGFLGPNGSGKTTTIRMLLGLINPSAGSWRLLGRDMPRGLWSSLPEIGALVEGPAFYPWLSGPDNLARFDAAGPDPQASTRRDRTHQALERVGLAHVGKKPYKAYSLGMRQRLGLASALLRPRRLLILDEPTNGMDPQGTRDIRNLIREMAGSGATIFLSSHLLAEVEQICTHAAVMSQGRLLAQGPLAEIQAEQRPAVEIEVDDPANAEAVLGRLGVESRLVAPGRFVVELNGQSPEACNRALVLGGVGVRSLTPFRRSLEDAFVALTGESADVVG